MPSLVRPLSVGQFGVAQGTGGVVMREPKGVKTCLDVQARKHVVDWAHLERGSSTEVHRGGILNRSKAKNVEIAVLEFDQ